MAGKKQQAQKPIEEDDEGEEGWDSSADVDAESPDQDAGRMRDWRDVEKYREMRELRRLVGDDFDFTTVLGESPVRKPGQPAPKGKPAAAPPQKVKPAPAPAPKAPALPQKPAVKPVAAKAHAKPAAAHKPAAKPHPKAEHHAKPKAKAKPAPKLKAKKR